jgi:hypothetical protein
MALGQKWRRLSNFQQQIGHIFRVGNLLFLTINYQGPIRKKLLRAPRLSMENRLTDRHLVDTQTRLVDAIIVVLPKCLSAK